MTERCQHEPVDADEELSGVLPHMATSVRRKITLCRHCRCLYVPPPQPPDEDPE